MGWGEPQGPNLDVSVNARRRKENDDRHWELRCPDHGTRRRMGIDPSTAGYRPNPIYTCDFVSVTAWSTADVCGAELESWCLPGPLPTSEPKRVTDRTEEEAVEPTSMKIEVEVDAQAVYEAAAAYHDCERTTHTQLAKVHADAADRLRRIAAVHYRQVKEQPLRDLPVEPSDTPAQLSRCLAQHLESGRGQCLLNKEHHGPHTYEVNLNRLGVPK